MKNAIVIYKELRISCIHNIMGKPFHNGLDRFYNPVVLSNSYHFIFVNIK